ncbi:ABC transporter permease [Paenibacillus pasadenensis]|uniref:Streptolysin S export transmembrane permease (SagI) n=1 Tax=Paenibacillus pasadenensis TaxID=217090 RepID=A0A2N5NDR6_9BACL|nr:MULTISPECIES: ABC transporter permease [Paenibacillus]PLT48462.1 Streptolysin S export transmembrane permease (SagI) [Paenibacillus pasadenensis]QGG58057.1 ABC transporter permease [Paenibacillus sp. B01]
MIKDLAWLFGFMLRGTFRKRSSWMLYLGLPVVGVLTSVLLYSGTQSPPLRVAIVNEDGAARIAADTAAYVGGLREVQVQELGREEAKKEIASGSLDVALLLEPGFSAAAAAGHPQGIALESVKGASVTAYVKSMLDAYLSNVAAISRAADGDGAAFEAMYAAYRDGAFKLTAESARDTSVARSMSAQAIGFLILFMLMSAVNLSEMLLKSRENRTYLRILSSPVPAGTYVLANTLVNLSVMAVQIALALGVMRFGFGIDAGMPLAELGALLLLFGLVSVSLSLAIVAFSRSSAMASALSNFIITPSCLLAGCFFPASIMPETIRRIGDFMPQRWVLTSIDALQSGQYADIPLHIAVLLAFALVFFLAAAFKLGRSDDTRSFV